VDLLLAHLCRFPVRSPVGLARGFSGKSGLSPFVPRRAPHRGSGSRPLAAPPWICLRQPPTHLDRDFQPPAVLSLLRPPIAQTPNPRNRTVHLLSLAYASRPPLRGRLTLGGLTFPRNPWAFGAQGFHLRSRYSCRHSRFRLVQPSSRSAFSLSRNAPLPLQRSPSGLRSVGGVLSPVELSAQRRLTSELLRTL